MLVCLLAALEAAAAQTLESLARTYRDSPTPAARAALLRYAAAHPKDVNGALALLAVGVTEAERSPSEVLARLEAARPRLSRLADYVAYYAAKARLAQKEYAGVAAELETVWRVLPPSPLLGRAALLAAKAYREAGDAAAAAAVLRKWRDRLAQPEGDLALAEALEAVGDLAQSAAYYQRVYYEYPLHAESRAAATALERIRAVLGSSYPPPMPQAQLERAAKLLRAGLYLQARSEYESLIGELGGSDRDVARVRRAAVEYWQGRTAEARRALETLEVKAPEAEAERLYYLVACARRLQDPEAMSAYLERLARDHAQSEWRLQALIWAANDYLLRNDRASYEPLFRACYESFGPSERTAYCHWRVAWAAYLERRPEAEGLLREHALRFPDSVKNGAAVYFLGRLAEERGDRATAAACYRAVSDRYPNQYYAVLSARRAERAELARVAATTLDGILPAAGGATATFQPGPETKYRIERAGLLARAALYELAEDELLFDAAGASDAPARALEAAELAARRGAHDRAMRLIKRIFPEYLSVPWNDAPRRFWQLAFPFPYRTLIERHARRHKLDPLLLAGLIRQESEFNPRAVSPARAYGLMQILPSTGRRLARTLRLRYRTSLLFQPDYNLRLGTYYLRKLLDEYGGRPEPALAAFNAGKTRADTWLAWYNYREPEEFVETIPLSETRGYVQSVLRNAEVYRRLYGAAAPEVPSNREPSRKSARSRSRS
ncbi:MAG TPA: transglycosylase SLT domain-containing protein [Bryobacteraceae bacterium]|nr:transglycosylase SLT domain-containing protein [Bryobacteraceae bacterium]